MAEDPAGPHDASLAASSTMGERIAAAWSAGTLVLPLRDADHPVRLPGLSRSVLPASLTGTARVALAGVGETFAAWRVVPPEHPPLIVRVPHRDPAELHQPLAAEVAALTLAPPEVGPEPVAVQEDATDGPLGLPYVVTTEVPGTAAAPRTWTDAHLLAHARLLARLHAVPAPGRGPLRLGEDPWAGVPTGPASLLGEVEQEVARWRERAAAALAEQRLEPFLEVLLERVADIEAEVAALDGFVLAHGDLCATNVLWSRGAMEQEPHVRFIDFEWAQGDDPARDLAILGGTVTGGPWFVPMDEQATAGFVEAYVRERPRHGELPASVADLPSLRRRMRAWTAYDRTALLVHLAHRGPRTTAARRALGELRSTLSVELGIAD